MNPIALLITIPSDSHAWNLIYMQLLLEENDFDVHNLGACTTYQESFDACLNINPDVVVISTVNGHGYMEGIELITKLRQIPELKHTDIYIGGKLNMDTKKSFLHAMELEAAGYTKAYYDDLGIDSFVSRLKNINRKVKC